MSSMCIVDNISTYLFGVFPQFNFICKYENVDSITHLAETSFKQSQYLRAHILIYLIMRLSMSYNNVGFS
jgi:hypothetical protein